MTEKARINVLVENTATAPGLLGEHGLAFWIEFGARRILLDTGQSGILVRNADQLGIPLAQVDAVVLSHGHYDHTGGLAECLGGASPAAIYAHPDALRPKFARNKDGSSRAIGASAASLRIIEERRDRWVSTEKPTAVAPGLTVTGPVPRVTDFEDTGGPFFLDAACLVPDPLLDDQAVFFDSTQGTVVLLGCAHAGIINTLRYIRQLTGGRPIHAVLGGMHLIGASPDRLRRTLDELLALNIGRLEPAHCTGRAATAALWDALPERCFPCNVGTQVEFDLFTPFTEGAWR